MLDARRSCIFKTLNGVKRNSKNNSNKGYGDDDDDDEKKSCNKRMNTFLLHARMAGRYFCCCRCIHTMLPLHSVLRSPSSRPKKTYRHKNTNTITWTQPSARRLFLVVLFFPVNFHCIFCKRAYDRRTYASQRIYPKSN